MTYEELVRTVSMKVRDAFYPGSDWQEMSLDAFAKCRGVAASALSAVRAQGVALAYQTATGPMLRAGIAAFDLASAPMVAMDKSWSAMLAVGEIRPEEGRQ